MQLQPPPLPRQFQVPKVPIASSAGCHFTFTLPFVYLPSINTLDRQHTCHCASLVALIGNELKSWLDTLEYGHLVEASNLLTSYLPILPTLLLVHPD